MNRFKVEVTDTELLSFGYDSIFYINPVNGSDLEFETKEASGRIYYITKLKTKLILAGADHEMILSIFREGLYCSPLKLTIEELHFGAWVEKWVGEFSASHCTVNEDDCTTMLAPDENGLYTCLSRAGLIQYNILDIEDVIQVVSANANGFEFIECTDTKTAALGGGSDMCDINRYADALQSGPTLVQNNLAFGTLLGGTYAGWQLFSNAIRDHSYPTPTTPVADIKTVWFRQKRITLDIAGVPTPPTGTWTNNGSTLLPDGRSATEWVRLPYNGDYYDKVNYAFENPSNCWHIQYFKPPSAIGEIYYKRGRLLNDVIEFLNDKSPCNIPVKSDLLRLNSDLTLADNDYVTKEPCQVSEIVVFQKSDVVFPTASEPAITAKISWNELMDILRGFNIWYAIVDGVIRIEHYSWFTKTTGLDLTADEYANVMKRTKQYSIIRSELPSIERFKMMEQDNIDFRGVDITYSSACVNKDKESGILELSMNNVTTDVAFIQTDPSTIALDGFVFMATEAEGSNQRCIESLGALSGQVVLNAPLSWANIHENYYLHNRVIRVGNLNGTDRDFISWRRTKQQVPLTFVLCYPGVINPNDYITTVLGLGVVDSIIERTKHNQFTIVLKYY